MIRASVLHTEGHRFESYTAHQFMGTINNSKNDQSFFVGLKAFIADGEKLLIVQDTDGQWELPGGKIQAGEDVPTAFKRELAEEVSKKAQIELGPVFHVWIRQPNPNKKDFFIFLVGLRCFWRGGEVVTSDEHKNFRWIAKKEVDSIDFENTYKDAIIYYFQSIEK